MKFAYEALDGAGKRVRGEISAQTENDALSQLRSQKLVPTSLRENNGFLGREREEGQSIWQLELSSTDAHEHKFKPKKLILTFNQLGIMLRAGVNLSMALEVMEQNESDSKMKRVLKSLNTDLLAGVSLSDSMRKHKAFDAVAVNLVRAGEADGHLERSFEQIASVIEKSNSIKEKIKSAMIYPAILLVLVIGVIILLNVVVLPSFTTMFEQLGTGMPAITMFVVGLSNIMLKWGWLIIIIIVLLVLAFRYAHKNVHEFRYVTDRFVTYIPVIGKLIKNSQVARFSRILSTLLESGQDFLSSLSIAQATLTNTYITDGLSEIGDDVRFGMSMTNAFSKHKFFEPIFISMIRAGEESGAIGETLTKMADLYETETDESAKRLTTLMEPAITIIIAGVVGVVILAIAIPMFSMFSMVGNV